MVDYVAIRKDRGNGGKGEGCATFIKKDVPHRVFGLGQDQKYAVVEVWFERKELVVINY